MTLKTIQRTIAYANLAKDSLQLRWARDDKSREAAQRLVAQRLGKLRGLPQKVGQMLAFSSDEQRQDAFGGLFESAEPLPWATMRPILEQAWEVDPETLFEKIETQGKAASLGQVHAATLTKGTKVAIKIQYPGIRNAVLADLKGLTWLAKPFGNLQRGFDLAGYQTTILAGLEEELDYRREAANQREFAAGPGSSSEVIVPRVDETLSTENILVSEWIDGDTWEKVQAEWTQQEKTELGQKLLRWFLESLFTYGQVHADLHPGNIRFIRGCGGPKIVLYDFGSVYRLTDTQRWTLLRLIDATRRQSEAPLPLLAELGFDVDLLQPLSGRLPALCRILLEPFCSDYPYDVRQWKLSPRLNELLGDERMNFRIAGPPRLLFLLRAFQAVITYLTGLDAQVMWGKLVEPHLQRERAAYGKLSLPKIVSDDFSTLAQKLKVQVKRGGMVTACVTLPASAIDRLEDFLDPQTCQKIAEERLDLKAIVRDVRHRGYVPGPVFELTDPQRDVKVWLE
ncbi:AarF/ABC1/UbiB kinase family protein [Bremerella cremea]|uniref:AarF/ABC1/UbiB kinase family protein n=2 Tax=Bremerella cremea TaxID=1031537 RepID=A0A368KXG9_9BACT|nr:AarF/ABC1/UbiB kinase family protein [Bremerella cremea]